MLTHCFGPWGTDIGHNAPCDGTSKFCQCTKASGVFGEAAAACSCQAIASCSAGAQTGVVSALGENKKLYASRLLNRIASYSI